MQTDDLSLIGDKVYRILFKTLLIWLTQLQQKNGVRYIGRMSLTFITRTLVTELKQTWQ